MTDGLANGHVSRGFTEVRFRDQYGEERTMYRQKGSALRIKRREDTVSHLLNRAAAVLIGQRIKAKRKAAGYTLAGLLERAGLVAAPGMGKNRMFEIENGGVGTNRNKQGVRFGTLYAIAMALDCEPSELMPSAAEVAKAAGIGMVIAGERLTNTGLP